VPGRVGDQIDEELPHPQAVRADHDVRHPHLDGDTSHREDFGRFGHCRFEAKVLS
jgi:hypothetical protein